MPENNLSETNPQLVADECFEIAVDRQAVPYIEQYFGVWAMQERQFRAGVQMLRGFNLHMHLATQQQRAQERAAEGRLYPVTAQNIAIIELHGAMLKHVGSLSNNTSTVLARRKLRMAAADPEVSAILLHIDSPGGTVSGTQLLADDVAELGKQKAIWTYFEDLGASAAVWVGSQAKKAFANATAEIGSIGVYGVIEDYSAQAAMLGIKVHVISTGKFKGAGVEGTPISAEMLAEYQTQVDDLNEHFVRAVASGRGMSIASVREIADGRIHIAAKAKELGLVDGVQSLDATLSQLAQLSAKPKRKTEAKAMSDSNTGVAAVAEVKAATIAQIRSVCKGADDKFILAQIEAGATLEQVKDAWIGEQNARFEAQGKELEKAKHAATTSVVGVEPVTGGKGLKTTGGAAGGAVSGDTFDGNAKAEFKRRVDEKVKGGMSRLKAAKAVAHEDEDLHRALLQQTNPEGHKAQQLAMRIAG